MRRFDLSYKQVKHDYSLPRVYAVSCGRFNMHAQKQGKLASVCLQRFSSIFESTIIQHFEADFLWKVSLKILNSGKILKTFTHLTVFQARLKSVSLLKYSTLPMLSLVLRLKIPVYNTIWASSQENLSSVLWEQQKVQTSLISAFVIRLLERLISKLATSKISIF